MDWYEQSQKAFGLILKGTIRHQSCPSNNFCPPFDKPVKFMEENPEWAKEDIFLKFSPTSEWENAMRSAQSLNGSATTVDWTRDLERMRIGYDAGGRLIKMGSDLQAGKEINILPAIADLRLMEVEDEVGLVQSSKVDLANVKNLKPSGWREYDLAFGGMPVSGPLIIFAPTKTGKSFCASKFVKEYLDYYKEDTVGYFTLEMPKTRYLKRTFEMYPDMEEKVGDRLWITSRASTMKDIIAMTATRELDMIVIDGIAQTIHGEKSASKFDEAWSDIERLGRMLEIPIVVLAQPNRNSKFNATERFLTMYDIEWSGAAENCAEQLVGLQYVREASDITKATYPVKDDTYYMIMFLQRDDPRIGAILFDEHVETPKGRRLWESGVHGIEKDGEIIPTLYLPGKYQVTSNKTSSRRA